MNQLQLLLDVHRQGGYFAKTVATCHEKVRKDHMPNMYPDSLKAPDTEFVANLKTSGFAFEAKMFATLATNPGVVVIVEKLGKTGNRTRSGRDEVERKTFQAYLDPSVKVICGGRIGPVFESLLSEHTGVEVNDNDRISQPDILIKDTAGSKTVLIPVDVKDHSTTDSSKTKPQTYDVWELEGLNKAQDELTGSLKIEDWMQLAHYHRHLENLDLVAEPTGAVVGREEKMVFFSLTEKNWLKTLGAAKRSRYSALEIYDYYFALGVQLTANARLYDAGELVDDLSSPEWNASNCSACPWREVCLDELKAVPGGGHLTLLPGVTIPRAHTFKRNGVEGIRTLARLDTETALYLEGKAPRPENPDLATLKFANDVPAGFSKAIYQARVHTQGKIARAEGVRRVNLRRADVEVDFDLENSNSKIINPDEDRPRQLVYLWGTREVRRVVREDGTARVTRRVRQFYDWSDSLSGEAKIFAQFWDFLMGSKDSALKQGKTWRSFHYTSHERTWSLKLAARHAGVDGVPTVEEVEKFFDSDYVVDMYPILAKDLYWPTMDHSIKSLAKWARFSWRSSNAGGDQSLLWYQSAVDTDPSREEQSGLDQDKLLSYNVDDVAAQEHLRDWIENLQSGDEKIPPVSKVRRPTGRF